MSDHPSTHARKLHGRGKAALRAEWILAAAVVATLIHVIQWFWTYGQLPLPYFYGPEDTFMDWFHPAYWSRNYGAYRIYKSVYPPLTFAVGYIFSTGSCYGSAWSVSAFLIRDCDWVGRVFIYAMFLLNIPLIALTFRKIDRQTWLPRTIALAGGLPMTYSLERGNIIMLCFTCVLLAWGPLLRSARLRWLFAGLAVNFKIYMIGAIAAQLLRRRWLWFEGAMIATIGVYLVTWGLVGEGSPAEILGNIIEYSKFFISYNPTERVWFPSTPQPLIALFEGHALPVVSMFGSRIVEGSVVALTWATRIAQVIILAGAFAAWLRPGILPRHRVVALAIALAMVSSEAGGYSQILLIFFVLMERWKGIGSPFAIVLCYILCLPGDIAWAHLKPYTGLSWLAGHEITVHIDIGLGLFFRPVAIGMIGSALACTTIWSVWQAHRRESALPASG